eukprot:XP_027326305.1 tripartite motif-containing protein 10-like isoform X2 [Anas platyrhynchos]
MASAASRARERGEEGAHHIAPKHRPDPEHLSCGGGTAKSCPERGRLGDAEAISHRNHLRKGNFQPKLHLEHLAEKLKLLGLEGGGEEEQLCSWHKRTFAFRRDAKASCCGAPRACGEAHREEPAQEDREQIHRDLESLKKHREELLELKASGERRCQGYLTQTEAERQKIVSEFRQLRRFLKDKEVVLLAQLGELDREVMRRQEEEEAKVSGEISLLDILIWEAERKLEQPTSGFLQSARSTMGRWETSSTRRMMETFSDLERRLRVISQQNDILREALGRFQGMVEHNWAEQGLFFLLGGRQICLLLPYCNILKICRSKQLEIMTSNVVLHPLDILPSELEKEVEPSQEEREKHLSLWTLILPTRASSCPGTAGG